MSQYDEDLPDQNFGALGGLGTEAFEKITNSVAPDGLHTRCYCEFCGTKNEIISSWPEVIVGSLSLVPPDWYVDRGNGALYPRVGCANNGCRREIGIRYAPQELARYVASGLGSNVVYLAPNQPPATPQQVEGFKQQMLQAAGGRR